MSSTREETRQTVVLAVGVSLAGLVSLWVLYLVRHVLLVLYVAVLFAVGFSPAVRWLEQRLAGRRIPRWAAILVLYLGFLAAVTGICLIVLPPLFRQASELQTALPSYIDQMQSFLIARGVISHNYTWSELVQQMPSPGMALTSVVQAVQGALGVLGALLTVLILPVYLLLESKALQVGLVRLFPRDRRLQMGRVIQDVGVKVSAWVGGQILLSLIIGSTAALGLWLLGVPYFYVLALLAGIGELIPIVGPIIAAVPAVLVALTVSTQTGLFTVIYFTVQQFVENHFLVPRMMERQVGVSPVTVIVALLIGSELMGLVGALLAVPTAAIIQVLFQELRSDAEHPAPRKR
jgi:predicted PurR-regulated permease PerM